MNGVRYRMRQLAEEGYFGSLGYKAEPTDALTTEMDELFAQLMERARQTLREHKDKVEALAEALLEKEELDADAASAILGQRPARE